MLRTAVVLLVAVIVAFGGEEDSIPVTRWVGPEGSHPGTYQEWVAGHPFCDTCRDVVLDTVIANGDGPYVSIFTDERYADDLGDELRELSDNLAHDGFSVRRWSVDSLIKAETLKERIRQDSGIKGALFIGDIPTAWFQVRNDSFDSADFGGYAQWPCDLFYMDLDGEWRDDSVRAGYGGAGQDSIYDAHVGDVAPEIYVARLMPYGLSSKLTRFRQYFRKNSAFRHDTLRLPSKALFFIDDDWVLWTDEWSQELAMSYADTAVYSDSCITTAPVYRQKLTDARAWVSVFAHSYPYRQLFYREVLCELPTRSGFGSRGHHRLNQ